MKRTGICAFLFAALLALTLPLLPFQDDWTYLTAPNPDFTWHDLLPGAVFWRPFDALWGGALGIAPTLFPWANRIAIALGHVLCVSLAARLAGELCEDPRGRFASIGFFALSSGTAAVLVNTDSLNLVWSCFWGCLGTLALARRRSLALAFGCYAVSALCKESGLSWLAAGPLLLYAKDLEGRRFLRRAATGFCLFVLYVSARFALQRDVAPGDDSYALTLDPKTLAANFAILAGLSLSGVDALAFFTGRHVLFGASLLFSLIAWCAFARCTFAAHGQPVARRLLAGAVVVLAFAAPHCLFKNHHPAEMHFYPVVLGGALAVASIPLAGAGRMAFGVFAAAMCAVFAIGWFDKMATIYASSAKASALFNAVQESGVGFDASGEYRVKGNSGTVRYSVFLQPATWCLDYGRAFRCLNDWRESKLVLVEEPELRDEDSAHSSRRR